MMRRLIVTLLLILGLAPYVWAARTFNGTDQAMQAGSVDLSGNSAASLSFWLWVDAWPASADSLLFEFSSNYNNVTTGFVVDAYSETSFYGAVIGDVDVNSSTYDVSGVSTGAWHHYLFVFDKTQATNEVVLYLDGSVQTPSSTTTNDNSNDFAVDTLNFMARGGASFWVAGQLADVAVWNMALGSTEATSLYGGSLASAVQAANLKGYWKTCGVDSPEPDTAAAHNASLIGTPTQSAHPAALTSCNPTVRKHVIVVQ